MRFLILLISILASTQVFAQQCSLINKVNGVGYINPNNKPIGDRLGEVVVLIGDVDGDGVKDIAVRSDRNIASLSIHPVLEVYSGRTLSHLDLVNPPGVAIGSLHNFGDMGDVDGDGLADIYFDASVPFDPEDPESSYVAGVIVYSPARRQVIHSVLPRPDERSSSLFYTFGEYGLSIGDVNGDGARELVIGLNAYDEPECSDDCRTGIRLYDGTTGVEIALSNILDPEFGRYYELGDVDGRGANDFAIELDSEITIYSAEQFTQGLDPFLVSLYHPEVDVEFGQGIVDLGDQTGDGLDDFGILSSVQDPSNEMFLEVISLDVSGTETNLQFHNMIQFPDGISTTHLETTSDIDGDDNRELVVLNQYADFETDLVALNPLTGTELSFFSARCPHLWTVQFASPGDVDGDGYQDMILGCSWDSEGVIGYSPTASYNITTQSGLAGALILGSLSDDADGSGTPDVCEKPEEPAPGESGTNPVEPLPEPSGDFSLSLNTKYSKKKRTLTLTISGLPNSTCDVSLSAHSGKAKRAIGVAKKVVDGETLILKGIPLLKKGKKQKLFISGEAQCTGTVSASATSGATKVKIKRHKKGKRAKTVMRKMARAFSKTY